ncbi:Ig-like domain-containing protein [Streptomyces erythrochromogenes]|uniref:Ig-like domain-containing protein n=1 Tax=Streptomyces erythrochromogenes TaxID=285574 RepID=UPI00367E0D16
MGTLGGIRSRTGHGAGRIGRMLLTGVGAAALALVPATAHADPISSSGPLSEINISRQLNCSVRHALDTEPEWYAGTACGTFVALNGTLFGPASVPAGGSAGPRTAYSEVSQTGPTGTGTSADPFKVVTVVNAGTGVTLTQTDTYVVGQERYDTEVTVQNASGTAQSGNIYTGGDCYLQNSDEGYGRVVGQSVLCSSTVEPGGRVEGLLPRSAGSSYFEGVYDDVWARIGSQQPLPNTCDCSTFIDNGIALSWPVSVADGASTTYRWTTVFSPSGTIPLVITDPATGSTLTDNTPTFSGTAAPGSTVTLTDGGTVICTAVADDNGAWECTPVAPLKNGEHVVTPTATDGQGNTTTGDPVTITIDYTATAVAACPPDSVLTGGGLELTGPAPDDLSSKPVGDTWVVSLKNNSGKPVTATPFAVCALTSP